MRLAIILSLLFLAGCATSSNRSAAERVELARIPQALVEACRGAADLPARDLTTTDVARLWATDRQSLGDCVRRHAALAGSVRALQGQGL